MTTRDQSLNSTSAAEVWIGCAGWSIPAAHAARFPPDGTHLERYARRFPAVEINTSFYRHHRPATYARWAASVPANFQFAVKVPKEVTHVRRLVDVEAPLERLLAETEALGAKRGPLLVQLPPSLAFDAGVAGAFFARLRQRFSGEVVCEPRHASWFTREAERLLIDRSVARVAADPALLPAASEPGGWPGLVYYRLHGAPRMYYSAYSAGYLETLARALAAFSMRRVPVWCIFDNTAEGAATADALRVLERLRAYFQEGS